MYLVRSQRTIQLQHHILSEYYCKYIFEMHFCTYNYSKFKLNVKHINSDINNITNVYSNIIFFTINQ